MARAEMGRFVSSASPVIALLAALEEEASGLRRQMALVPEGVSGLRAPAYTGLYRQRPVLLAWTGMGQQRAEASAQVLLARYPVVAVLSIGFSGALEGELGVGDLVLASELAAISGPGGQGIEPARYEANPDLLATASGALKSTSLRVLSGPTVTAPDIISTPEGKQALGRQTGALAVDMESYWLAKMASERGLPFLALRAISDAQEDRLPPLQQILGADGEPRARPLAAYLIREPRSLPALLRLARNATRAQRVLTTGVTCAVTAL
jgi:adenosylhomocysteine nucleosidase